MLAWLLIEVNLNFISMFRQHSEVKEIFIRQWLMCCNLQFTDAGEYINCIACQKSRSLIFDHHNIR